MLSLSKLQKFDEIPFIVCLIKHGGVDFMLANSTFLKKISHSSHSLTLDNIRGSFNGSDIVKSFNDINNNEYNFMELFAIHAEIGFEGNLLRLVEATHDIFPNNIKYKIDNASKINIEASVSRALQFCHSTDFIILKNELDARVKKYENEILIASHIENTNIRARLIEFLITSNDDNIKNKLITAIKHNNRKLPKFQTENTLGDYEKIFDNYHTVTDIKTKVIILNSNPKAYNIDKFLEFHSRSNTVFLFYFIGIGEEIKIFNKILISVFQHQLLQSTIVLKHWAGRGSRGVT